MMNLDNVIDVYSPIPQYPAGEVSVDIPIYGRTVYKGDVEEYPILRWETAYCADLCMPSLASQWRVEWMQRTNRAKRRGVYLNAPRTRAPESFIKTGRWPKDIERPTKGGN